jgi:hypothetical protein
LMNHTKNIFSEPFSFLSYKQRCHSPNSAGYRISWKWSHVRSLRTFQANGEIALYLWGVWTLWEGPWYKLSRSWNVIRYMFHFEALWGGKEQLRRGNCENAATLGGMSWRKLYLRGGWLSYK